MLSSHDEFLQAITEGLRHRPTYTTSVNPASGYHWGEAFRLTIEDAPRECVIVDVSETFTPAQGLVKNITVAWLEPIAQYLDDQRKKIS